MHCRQRLALAGQFRDASSIDTMLCARRPLLLGNLGGFDQEKEACAKQTHCLLALVVPQGGILGFSLETRMVASTLETPLSAPAAFGIFSVSCWAPERRALLHDVSS